MASVELVLEKVGADGAAPSIDCGAAILEGRPLWRPWNWLLDKVGADGAAPSIDCGAAIMEGRPLWRPWNWLGGKSRRCLCSDN